MYEIFHLFSTNVLLKMKVKEIKILIFDIHIILLFIIYLNIFAN